MLFSIISALLTGLSFDFLGLSFLVWFSLIPFLYVINKSSIKKGILNSFLFGFVYSLTIIFWIARVSLIGLVALVFYLSFYYILFFFLSRYFFKKRLSFFTVPSTWIVLEALRESIWCGFGWPNLGYTQYRNLYLIGVADIFGVKFISFLILMSNVVFYELLFKRRFILKKLIIFFLIISVCVFYSFYKLNNLKEESFLNISSIQPNFSEELKQDETKREYILDKLDKLIVNTNKNSLVVLPEATWPYIVDENEYKRLENFIANREREILIGAIVKEEDKFYNSALLFNSTGKLIDLYHKIKLVPFGEYVPLRRFLSFIDVLNSIGDLTRGNTYKKFNYRGKTFSILICFEDIFPLFVSDVSMGADFLINITNDGWFGGQPEANQHFAIMTFRAIENRISIVRCANTGITGVVLFNGRSYKLKKAKKDVFFEGVFEINLPLMRELTFYSKFGDIFCIFCGFFLLIFVIFSSKLEKRNLAIN